MIDIEGIFTTSGQPFDAAGYEVILRPLSQDEGGGWLATIPALPGCSGDGESEMGAISDVRLAALEWARAAAEAGEPVPAPSCGRPVAAE